MTPNKNNMKKIVSTFLIVFAMITVNAQTVRIGLAGAFNSTWLFNKNVSDAGSDLDYKSTFGGQFGISGVFIAANGPGVSLEILSSSVNQKYNWKFDSVAYESETKLKTIAIPLLFRYTSKQGFYFEIGPEFSFITGAKAVISGTTNEIKKDKLNSLSTAAVLGFGWDIKAGNHFVISPGLRFAWGLGDVFKKPTDGKDVYFNSKTYSPTNTAVGGFHLGITYKIAGN